MVSTGDHASLSLYEPQLSRTDEVHLLAKDAHV